MSLSEFRAGPMGLGGFDRAALWKTRQDTLLSEPTNHFVTSFHNVCNAVTHFVIGAFKSFCNELSKRL